MLKIRELLFGTAFPKDHNPFKPHRVDFFAILIITEGVATHLVDFGSYTLKAGNSLMVSKGQIHAFDTSPNYDGYLVIHTEEFIINAMNQSAQTKIFQLYNYHLGTVVYQASPTNNEHLLSIVQEEEIEGDSFEKSNILGAALSIYLLKLGRGQQFDRLQYKFGRNYEVFEQFKHAVEQGYTQSRNAKIYASQLGLSYKTLNKICKIFTEKTAKVFIDDYILLEAKRFLSATSLSVKEISYKCGFDEPTNFLKYFKKLSNQTPVQFRKKYL
ncbi:MAG: helix-turn-helix domain-containing protein [Aureispira sp.]|nr:helix-turn-helix domain-containing protein [Aureispira sp.]